MRGPALAFPPRFSVQALDVKSPGRAGGTPAGLRHLLVGTKTTRGTPTLPICVRKRTRSLRSHTCVREGCMRRWAGAGQPWYVHPAPPQSAVNVEGSRCARSLIGVHIPAPCHSQQTVPRATRTACSCAHLFQGPRKSSLTGAVRETSRPFRRHRNGLGHWGAAKS